MRKGIEKLAYELSKEDGSMTIGQMADKYGESTERTMDALDVIKLVQGRPTQFPPIPWGVG